MKKIICLLSILVVLIFSMNAFGADAIFPDESIMVSIPSHELDNIHHAVGTISPLFNLIYAIYQQNGNLGSIWFNNMEVRQIYFEWRGGDVFDVYFFTPTGIFGGWGWEYAMTLSRVSQQDKGSSLYKTDQDPLLLDLLNKAFPE